MIISVENYAREKKSALFKELQDLIKRAPLGAIDEIISMKEEGRK